ncbi:MAG: ATP-binding protein [Chloroflexi bacterium]|nr:ATP-binding protein [Chloroflexota bacterium]
MTHRVVRERIDPRLTASLFANYRNATDAILELVDNAVDSRLPGRPLRVDLTIRPESIALLAVGGTGMSPSELERDYLRWGGSRKRAGERIGRYGQGGKAAIGHLGNRFAVVASPGGDDRAYEFEDDAYRDRSRLRTYELRERAKPVAADLGYVRIEIGEVDRTVDPRRLRARLAEVYRPLLGTGDLIVSVNRGPVTPAPWPLEERRDFNVRGGGRMVAGWYGLLPDPPPPSLEPGIRLYHLGRLVGPPDWLGHPGPALHPGLNRLVGEVELSHVPVTMNKTDVDRDSAEWLAVEARLHRLVAPLVRRLAREGATAVNPSALRTADQVRGILARALRLLESGRLFESDAGSAGTGGGRAAPATPAASLGNGSRSRHRRDRRPGARSAPPERHGHRGRRAAGDHQRPLSPLRGALGRPVVPARDGTPRGVRDDPRGDRPGVRAQGERADGRVPGPHRTAAAIESRVTASAAAGGLGEVAFRA